jgi:hypothetical protein
LRCPLFIHAKSNYENFIYAKSDYELFIHAKNDYEIFIHAKSGYERGYRMIGPMRERAQGGTLW